MSQRVITVDDMTGKEALATSKYVITFTPQAEDDPLEDVSAEYDLTPEAAQAFWRWLSEGDTRDMASIMRKLPVRVANSDSDSLSETEVIRAWAKEKGMEVKDRGALPQNIREEYRKAHTVKVTESDDK